MTDIQARELIHRIDRVGLDDLYSETPCEILSRKIVDRMTNKKLIECLDDSELGGEVRAYLQQIVDRDENAKKHWDDIIQEERYQKINEILK